jgi:hypothetical protein
MLHDTYYVVMHGNLYRMVLGALSVIATLVGLYPYVLSIRRNQTHPHLFTWLVWGVLTSIIFTIQVIENAGPGAWCTGVTAASMFVIMAAGYRSGERRGTRNDRIALAASLSAIPLWILTKNPTFAAVFITCIDLVAFYPTVAKTWRKPYSEHLFYYWIWLIKYPLSLLALRTFTVATIVYPAAWTLAGIGFISMVLIRRQKEQSH